MSDQRITDEELSDIERETKALFAFGDTDYHIEHNFLRLLAELHRTRAELAAVRKALFEDAHSSHDHRYRAIARALGDLSALPNRECTCHPTNPATWTTHGSAVEPGSMYEPDPDCPRHK